MACIYVCDGCGLQLAADRGPLGWLKPRDWFQRVDKDGPQDACSRRCIDIAATRTGKTAVVLPL